MCLPSHVTQPATCDMSTCDVTEPQAANESAILDMEDGDDEAKDKDAGKGRKVPVSTDRMVQVMRLLFHQLLFLPESRAPLSGITVLLCGLLFRNSMSTSKVCTYRMIWYNACL